MDLAVNLRTTFRHPMGDLELDSRAILAHYARGWMVSDVVACVPVEIILSIVEVTTRGEAAAPRQLRLLRMLRVFRLMRLGTLFKLFKRFRLAAIARLMRLGEWPVRRSAQQAA
jgi:hypothetical protein